MGNKKIEYIDLAVVATSHWGGGGKETLVQEGA
jgi:hypothetical protein